MEKNKKQRLARSWDSPFYRAFLLAKHKAFGDPAAMEEVRIWEKMTDKAECFEGRRYGHG